MIYIIIMDLLFETLSPVNKVMVYTFSDNLLCNYFEIYKAIIKKKKVGYMWVWRISKILKNRGGGLMILKRKLQEPVFYFALGWKKLLVTAVFISLIPLIHK